MSAAARRLCRQFGITLKPNHEHCRAMQSHCINVIPALLEKHGVDTMVLTLRVTETSPNNRHQLNRDVITAVNAVCRLKRWTSLGLAFLEAWDNVDLGELRQRAISAGLWMQPVWATMAALIIDRLRAPAPPQVQACSPSHGRSGWLSQTQPQSSQREHFMAWQAYQDFCHESSLRPI